MTSGTAVTRPVRRIEGLKRRSNPRRHAPAEYLHLEFVTASYRCAEICKRNRLLQAMPVTARGHHASGLLVVKYRVQVKRIKLGRIELEQFHAPVAIGPCAFEHRFTADKLPIPGFDQVTEPGFERGLPCFS